MKILERVKADFERMGKCSASFYLAAPACYKNYGISLLSVCARLRKRQTDCEIGKNRY